MSATKRVDDPLFKQSYGFSREGETLRIEMWTEPGGGVLAEHVHPALEERYEVIEGEITINLDGERKRLGPGERAVVPPGVRHSFENTGERFTDQGSPQSFRALVQAAALAERYRDTVVLSSPPRLVQRLLFPPLARLARR
jgi:mannose-6-phosphate isomerase-like protein (cupin superfamily)